MKVKLLISHLVIGAFGATMAVAAFPKVMSAQTVTQADQSARPGPVAEGLRVELKIDTARDGALYVPKGYTVERPAPLLLWLHGAGGTGQVSDMLGALADEFGYIVLAPDSREWTWGAILGRWDADLDFIQKAIRQVTFQYSVDRGRIFVGGFSDGASFSLSLGISYGDTFKRVYAGSPGVMQPIQANGKPPIFISHGTEDQTMPIDVTSRKFVPRLKALGYEVTYREYQGRHQLPPEILREAIEWMSK
ncbi:MAG: phospholipase [Acidobacteria bacterium]|nr:MAG: phospholipase [Acidobacteriota bacterium]